MMRGSHSCPSGTHCNYEVLLLTFLYFVKELTTICSDNNMKSTVLPLSDYKTEVIRRRALQSLNVPINYGQPGSGHVRPPALSQWPPAPHRRNMEKESPDGSCSSLDGWVNKNEEISPTERHTEFINIQICAAADGSACTHKLVITLQTTKHSCVFNQTPTCTEYFSGSHKGQLTSHQKNGGIVVMATPVCAPRRLNDTNKNRDMSCHDVTLWGRCILQTVK